MHFHFCQKYECLGAKNVVLHRPMSILVWAVSCGNALLPSGRNVTSTNTGEAATIRQPEEHPGLLMAICWFPPKGSIPPQFPKCSVFLPKTCKFPPGGPCGPRLRITGLGGGTAGISAYATKGLRGHRTHFWGGHVARRPPPGCAPTTMAY